MSAAEIRQSFVVQAKACAAMGSPLTARVLRLLANDLALGTPVADAVLGWQGNPSGRADALALRLAGGLHALVRLQRDADLAALYAQPDSCDDTKASKILLSAAETNAAFLLNWLASAPQTNEVRRSAVLVAAAQWLSAHFGLPLILSELGASAGLNLLFDRYALEIAETRFGSDDAVLTLTPDWQGPLPPRAEPRVLARVGVDLNPLHPVADQLRLMSYLWADQTDRLHRTEQALAEAARLRPPLERGDAIDWLEHRLAKPMAAGCLHLVYHTVAWQYFPATRQQRGEAILQAAGARATAGRPLAHLSMETDGQPGGAALVLRLWPSGKVIPLGRADFHCRWIDWRAPAD